MTRKPIERSDNIFLHVFITKLEEGDSVTAALSKIKEKYKSLSTREDKAAVYAAFKYATEVLSIAFKRELKKVGRGNKNNG